MKNHRSTDRVLGIMATSRSIHAVLLQDGPDGPEVLRRFSRQRSAGAASQSVAVGVPETESENYGQDFSIQFGGDGSGSNELFLSSEFAGLEVADEDEVGAHAVATFEMELSDLFNECHDAGYDDAEVAFVLGSNDVTYVELRVPLSNKAKKPDKSVLTELLAVQHKGLVEEGRVFFLPMTPGEDNAGRYLAVLPKTPDPVSATLRVMHDQKDRLPSVRLLDAEVPLYVGIARAARHQLAAEASLDLDDTVAPVDLTAAGSPSAPSMVSTAPVNSLVVRSGFEETMVLFLQDGVVQHCESLRSLTAFDAPETVCSRVLLQQDEHGIGDVHHVLILSEERERDLIETFEMFFPDARVESMRSHLPRLDESGQPGTTATVSAIAAGLRLFDDPLYEPHFEDVNFLPRRLLKRRVRLPINWPVIMLSTVLGLTIVFFATRYAQGEDRIDGFELRLQENSEIRVDANIDELQASIDSMQQTYATYTRALKVLDTLLVGSDRWSRALEHVSHEAAAVEGLWIENMGPSEGSTLSLVGTSTDRQKVVDFAKRVDGTIELLQFSEIREWPVFTYTMTVPVENTLPKAAQYLREQAEEALSTEAAAGSPTNEKSL